MQGGYDTAKETSSSKQSFVIRDMRARDNFRVDDILVDKFAALLGPAAILVYLSLSRHVNREQEAWPGIKLMCRTLKMGPNTVVQAIRELERFGIIGVTRGKDSKNRQSVNVYILIDKSQWDENGKAGYYVSNRKPITVGHQSRLLEPVTAAVTEGVRTEGLNNTEGTVRTVDKSGNEQRPSTIRETIDRVRADLVRKGVISRKP